MHIVFFSTSDVFKAEEILKRKGITIISKVTGLFLSAFAAQMIFQGIKNLLFPA